MHIMSKIHLVVSSEAAYIILLCYILAVPCVTDCTYMNVSHLKTNLNKQRIQSEHGLITTRHMLLLSRRTIRNWVGDGRTRLMNVKMSIVTIFQINLITFGCDTVFL